MNLLNLVNDSNSNLEHVMQMVRHFFPYAQKQLGFHKPVMISFQSDEENANKLLGKTGYYNPDDFSIGIYVDGRHPKDLLRSLSHELVHHTQNCNGDFDSAPELSAGYAQENPAMRASELDAYKRGNIIFRDFEDLIKKGKISVNIDFKKAGEPKMSLKEWKDKELNTLLMEKWGYGKKAKTLSEEDEENIRNLTEIAPTDSVGYREEDEEEEELEEGAWKPTTRDWMMAQQECGTASHRADIGGSCVNDVLAAMAKEKALKVEGASEKAQERCGREAKNQQEYDECMNSARSGQAWQESRELEEGCPPEGHEAGGEAIDISGPGMEVHVDDISELSPEEAFAAGMAAAKDAIDQAIGGEAPPEGGGALDENIKSSIALDEARDVARRIFERIKEIK